MTDHTERNRAVAKAIDVEKKFCCPACGGGWFGSSGDDIVVCHKEFGFCGKSWPRDKGVNQNWFRPWTDLNQAADYLVPVVNEMGWNINGHFQHQLHCKTSDGGIFVGIENKVQSIGGFSGQGSATSEKMASSICETFLYLAKEYPELLKEALERLAA